MRPWQQYAAHDYVLVCGSRMFGEVTSDTNWLVRSLCQICRSLSRQERCLGCTTKRQIYFPQCTQTWTKTKIFQKPWKQEIAEIPEWPRRKAVAEFRLCVGHDCLGRHLHCNGIRPESPSTLCSFHQPMDRNHLEQCSALSNRTECERYWEAVTKMMENWLRSFSITLCLWLILIIRSFIFTSIFLFFFVFFFLF
jgi:hypothetical protein